MTEEVSPELKVLTATVMKMKFEDGDILGIQCPEGISNANIMRWQGFLEEWFRRRKKDIGVLMFPAGTEMKILQIPTRPTEPETEIKIDVGTE